MAKAKSHTLTTIAKVSGISRKRVQEVFAQQRAPSRPRPMEELVDYLRKAASEAVTLPPDLAEKMILLKYQSAQERKAYVIEVKEEKRLKNLEKKGQLVERGDVHAQGAAIGVLLSSSLSGMVKDLPSVLSGKSEREIDLFLKDKVDALAASIHEGLGKVGKLKAAVTDGEWQPGFAGHSWRASASAQGFVSPALQPGSIAFCQAWGVIRCQRSRLRTHRARRPWKDPDIEAAAEADLLPPGSSITTTISSRRVSRDSIHCHTAAMSISLPFLAFLGGMPTIPIPG